MVERDGLENRCTRKRTEGSNPSPSASKNVTGVKKDESWEKKLGVL